MVHSVVYHCLNRHAAPRELDPQNGELTDVRQEMEGLLDELTASRDKLRSYEEMLARVRVRIFDL